MSYQDISFEDGSFDGAYTMETLSHATDFHQAISELHRVLKPGGHLTLFEYEHDPFLDGRALKALTRVNDYSGMAAFQHLTSGTIVKELRAVGFEDVVCRDYTANSMPMLRLFFLIAYIPYIVICFLGLQQSFPNATAAVELWRIRDHIQYVAISAKKKGNS